MSPLQEVNEPARMAGADPVLDATSLLDDATAIVHEVRGLVHDQLLLVADEGRLAVRSLASMIAAAVAIGVLVVTAWLGLMSALALSAIAVGVSQPLAILAIVALNLISSVFLYWVIRRKSRTLGFPATLRTLNPPRAAIGNGTAP